MISNSLTGVDLSLFDVPVPVVVAAAPLVAAVQGYLVTMRQTRSGKDIMVCTVHPAPAGAIAEAAAKKLPLFTGPEIRIMATCLPEMVDHILEAKRVFPGITIQQIINEGAA
jgi:hypothetical protein